MMRVLVVDDDAQVLGTTTRCLLGAGYEVLTANNFKDARGVIDRGVPDVVIADVRLREYNGLQLGIVARQARSDVHLVIMSGWDDPVHRRHAAQLQAIYLQKPVPAAVLLAAVHAPIGAPTVH
jgi:DNA-binding response OmpR family regulator